MLLGLGLAAGQQPSGPATYNLPNSPTPMPSPQPQQDPENLSLPRILSNWVTYRDKTPPETEVNAPCTNFIGSELFLRMGSSTPFGAGVFPAVLNTGWLIEGGARAMLYNDIGDRAWTLQASLSNIYNSAHFNTDKVPIDHVTQVGNPGMTLTDATIRDLNRTFLNVGLGRDWYVWKPKHDAKRVCEDFLCNCTLSFGVDGGFRYGTARVQFDEIEHRTGVLSGAYAAAHTELQIPVGCHCMWELGLRAELGFTNSQFLVQTHEAFYDANVLFNTGIRY